MKRLLLISGAMVFILFFTALNACAQPVNPQYAAFLNSVNANDVIYPDSPFNKMGLGAINAATAWTDIPRRISELSEEHNVVVGCTVGLGEGIVNGIARGASGVIDIATFGVPPYDQPIMKPEYKVNNPNKEGFKVTLLNW